MLQQKLKIAPDTLHPNNKISFSSQAPTPIRISCTIKVANWEISIFLFAGWNKDRYKCLYFDGSVTRRSEKITRVSEKRAV